MPPPANPAAVASAPGAPLYEIQLIDASGSDRARRLTAALREALAEIGLQDGWVALSPPPGAAVGANPGPPVHRCAVLLAAPDTQPAPELARQLDACLAADIPVLPLVYDLTRCGEVLPGALGKFNALAWPAGTPGEPSVPPTQSVLRFAGLSETDRRVFISYRRTESTAVAEQLFSALARRGFNVFLDRYSIDAGAEFQAELMAELASRAMVVLLETQGVTGSKWVMEEVNYVRRHRLGLLAVTWPESRLPPKSRLPVLPDDYRVLLADNAFAAPGPDQPFVASNLEAIVMEIERTHAVAMARRRVELVGSLAAALRHRSITFHPTDAWGLLASTRPGLDPLHLAVVPRPATADSIYDCEMRRSALGVASACLIQPTTGLAGRQAEMVRWLTDHRPVACAHETEIEALAEALANP